MYSTILFDLDGTLIDSEVGIVKCLQYSLGKMGIVERDTAKLRRCIGPSLLETYCNLYGMNKDDGWKAIHFYRERFDKIGILENSLYTGVDELIKKLSASGKIILLATAKPTEQAQIILERYKLTNFFHTIAGSNLDGTRISKTEIIAFNLNRFPHIDLKKVVMVGDREHDIIGAKQNGITSIGVTYGFGSNDELKAANADYITHSVKGLEKLLLAN